MRKFGLFLLFIMSLLIFVSCSDVSIEREDIIIDMQDVGANISSNMYGVFFEEINHAGDGGLYAELIQNRSFNEKDMPYGYYAKGDTLFPRPVKNHLTGKIPVRYYKWKKENVPAWSICSDKQDVINMEVVTEKPKFHSSPNNLKLELESISNNIQLVNDGYWGMNIEEGHEYLLRIIIRTSRNYKGSVKARLVSQSGSSLGECKVECSNDEKWNDINLNLFACGSDNKAKFVLEFDDEGIVWIDYVSLFPKKTFMNRPNGLRDDVASMIAGLKPAFFRWPGGCVVEGITLDNRFEWKKTLGDPAARPGEYSTWGYNCSYGFGYHEMLQFCEDIGAGAMYVCNVGLGCQFRMGDACDEKMIDYYIDDCLDAIEYALGNVDTEWGALRASAGHPEPFPLKYVEIGNENWGDEYDRRFDLFYDRIKKEYPELILIYNEMPQREGAAKIKKADMIDPHYYVDPYFFFRNTTLFDEWERGKYNIYVGEYACNRNVGSGNMLAALSEAAFINGMERNGDLVTMESYAPLFENRNDRSWATNLIWIDNDTVVGRSSYYVQKMAAENRPDYNLKSNITMHKTEPEKFDKGFFGFGSKNSCTEYKDFKLNNMDRNVNVDLKNFISIQGKSIYDSENDILKVDNGIILLNKDYVGDIEATFKVRSISGDPGFQFYLNMNSDASDGYKFNAGMWSTNDRTEMVRLIDNKEYGVLAEHSGCEIHNNIWYDIKLVTNANTAKLFIDNKEITRYVIKPMPLQFIHSGYDEKKEELIIKVVNADDNVYRTSFSIKGSKNVERTGKIISLASETANDENSYKEPQKIYPKEIIYNKFNEKFEFDFPPFSYSIMRIKAKRK